MLSHAGKTYTMEGGMRDSSDGSKLSDVAGVIPRAINQIFEHVGRIGGDLNTVKCSFLELYNEEATDLLASSKQLHASAVGPGQNFVHIVLRRKPAGLWHTCNSILTHTAPHAQRKG
jgi:Kinesin motor domain